MKRPRNNIRKANRPKSSEAERNRAMMKQLEERKVQAKELAETNSMRSSRKLALLTGSIQLALLAAAAIAAGGAYMSCGNQEQPDTQPVSTKSAPSRTSSPQESPLTPEVIEKENIRLEKIEQAFMKFAKEIAERAEKHTDRSMLDEVKIPLNTMQGNLDNQEKSIKPAKEAAKNSPKGFVAISAKSTKHFYYQIAKMPEDVGASYNDAGRTISINENFDTNSLGDMFILFHELLHTEEDRLRKARRDTDLPDYNKTLVFLTTFPGKPVILKDEVRAHKITLEALNAYFEGALKELGAKTTTKAVIELFRKYNKNGRKVSNKIKVFSSMIAAQARAHYGAEDSHEKFRTLTGYIYQKSGMTLMEMTPTGGIKLMPDKFRRIQ